MNTPPADQTQQMQQGYFGLTDSIPQEGWYWAAMASVAVSAALRLAGKRDWEHLCRPVATDVPAARLVHTSNFTPATSRGARTLRDRPQQKGIIS